jgi:hypothetical protein
MFEGKEALRGGLLHFRSEFGDRLCGLVVRVSGDRSRGPGVLFPALPDFLRSSGSGLENRD